MFEQGQSGSSDRSTEFELGWRTASRTRQLSGFFCGQFLLSRAKNRHLHGTREFNTLRGIATPRDPLCRSTFPPARSIDHKPIFELNLCNFNGGSSSRRIKYFCFFEFACQEKGRYRWHRILLMKIGRNL